MANTRVSGVSAGSTVSLHMNMCMRFSQASTLPLSSKTPGPAAAGAHSVSALRLPWIAILAVVATIFCPVVFAADTCSDQVAAIAENKIAVGSKHHPFGRSLPTTPEFNQPDRCAETLWFFDKNGNGIADSEEVRVFGSGRQVNCGSCHGDSTGPKSAVAASVVLRLDPAVLCLVCHRL